MAHMRLLFIVLVAVLLLIHFVNGQSHNLFLGNPNPQYDRLIYREIIKRKPEAFSKISYNFTYPPGGFIPRETITAVRVYDQYRDDNGGHATLRAGGPGSKQVTINLKSKFWRGIDFICEIWGR